MRIEISGGNFAEIDVRDFALLSKYRWTCYVDDGGIRYARSNPGPRNNRMTILMHRLIMGCRHGEFVDHKNGDGLDNRRSNLRIATNSQNQMNAKSRYGTSIHKGVSWSKSKKKWVSRIRIKGHQVELGLFRSEDAAAMAYDAFAKEHFGEFARFNFRYSSTPEQAAAWAKAQKDGEEKPK